LDAGVPDVDQGSPETGEDIAGGAMAISEAVEMFDLDMVRGRNGRRELRRRSMMKVVVGGWR
jgi:hypothetical protein